MVLLFSFKLQHHPLTLSHKILHIYCFRNPKVYSTLWPRSLAAWCLIITWKHLRITLSFDKFECLINFVTSHNLIFVLLVVLVVACCLSVRRNPVSCMPVSPSAIGESDNLRGDFHGPINAEAINIPSDRCSIKCTTCTERSVSKHWG